MRSADDTVRGEARRRSPHLPAAPRAAERRLRARRARRAAHRRGLRAPLAARPSPGAADPRSRVGEGAAQGQGLARGADPRSPAPGPGRLEAPHRRRGARDPAAPLRRAESASTRRAPTSGWRSASSASRARGSAGSSPSATPTSGRTSSRRAISRPSTCRDAIQGAVPPENGHERAPTSRRPSHPTEVTQKMPEPSCKPGSPSVATPDGTGHALSCREPGTVRDLARDHRAAPVGCWAGFGQPRCGAVRSVRYSKRK